MVKELVSKTSTMLSITSFISMVKSFSAVITALGVIYGAMWYTGSAPITNSMAKDMVREAVDKKAEEIGNQIKNLETKIEKWTEETEEANRKIEKIDERTLTTKELQSKILDQLLIIRRNTQ